MQIHTPLSKRSAHRNHPPSLIRCPPHQQWRQQNRSTNAVLWTLAIVWTVLVLSWNNNNNTQRRAQRVYHDPEWQEHERRLGMVMNMNHSSSSSSQSEVEKRVQEQPVAEAVVSESFPATTATTTSSSTTASPSSGASIIPTSTTAADQADTTSTTTPAAQTTTTNKNMMMQARLASLGIVDYQVLRPTKLQDDTIPKVTMLVHHREFFAGCHSWERFFSPKWETIFVLEQDFVPHYGLYDVARDMIDSDQSRGVHFALLPPEQASGEWLGRAVALRILSPNHRPPLLFSTQCDIHPLPTWHAHHVPFDQVVDRMVRLFMAEDALNQQQQEQHASTTQIIEVQHDVGGVPLPHRQAKRAFSNPARPLLVMNTAMVETIPSADSLQGSIFHSHQTGLKCSWNKCYDRETFGMHYGQNLTDQQAWISDISTWVEDHLTLYNVTLLEEIIPRFLPVAATISAGVKGIPRVLMERQWKAIRLNDQPMFYDIAKAQHYSEGGNMVGGGDRRHALFDPAKYYRHVGGSNHSSSTSTSTSSSPFAMTWLQTKALSQLAKTSSPFGCLEEYMRLRVLGNVDVKIACIIAARHFQRNHVPLHIWNETIHQNIDTVSDMFKVMGYWPIRRTPDTLYFASLQTTPGPVRLDMIYQQGRALENHPSLHHVGRARLSLPESIVVGEWDVVAMDRHGTIRPEDMFHAFENKAVHQKVSRSAYQQMAHRLCQVVNGMTNSRTATARQLQTKGVTLEILGGENRTTRALAAVPGKSSTGLDTEDVLEDILQAFSPMTKLCNPEFKW